MSVLVYIPEGNHSGKQFLGQINDLFKEDLVEIIDHISGFAVRLRQPLGTADIAVLMPLGEQSLMSLLELYQEKLMFNPCLSG